MSKFCFERKGATFNKVLTFHVAAPSPPHEEMGKGK